MSTESFHNQPRDLLERLKSSPLEQFPRGYDYATQFQNLQNHLHQFYHSNVTTAAALSDGTGFLTDHGIAHIRTVIKRAGGLLATGSGEMPTAYETYILLAAIHTHDLGNFFGRKDHELNAERVMTALGPVLGIDEVEKLAIRDIARAHGGAIGSDKDKISRLSSIDHILGQKLRPQFLAALLRFADELADDRTRSSRYMIEQGTIPESSIIFHKYAWALHSVVIDANAVSLKFSLSESDVEGKWRKGESETFLIDEIYDRTMKMHRERLYCMRFLRPQVNVNRIDVLIEIFTSNFSQRIDSIPYRLEEAGYPDEKNPNIFSLCPELSKKTGMAVQAFISKQRKAGKENE